MALSKYEIVVLFDASNTQDVIDAAKVEVESLINSFGGKVLEKDDIGFLNTLYNIGSSSNPYFYSLYTELDGTKNKEFKRKMSIVKSVVRLKVLKMKDNQKFLKFKEIENELKNIDFSDITKCGIFNEIK